MARADADNTSLASQRYCRANASQFTQRRRQRRGRCPDLL